MSREIKVRGKVKWNGNHFFAGDWVEGFYAYKESTDEHVILVERANMNRAGSYFAEAEVIPETVGQYTGLKDKNGKEIYEGDIIRTHFSFSHEVVQEPFIIQWNKDKAMFEGVKQNPEQNEYLRSFSFFPEQRFIYEIIGNIHDMEAENV